MKKILISGGNGNFSKELQKYNTEYDIIAPSKNKMNVIDIGSGYADEMLLEASAKGYVIATNDKQILEQLTERGTTAIRIRGKKRLMITGSE